ncbi:MAG: arylsulfatase, partial [Acidobacteria bacterium]|nr:arylsulfatase [Acidobacteriota bacterium]
MQRRDFLRALGVASLTAAPSARPNIVVILADDLGFSDVGCYGGEIRTPNLDAMAKAGVRFTQFYNGARCCPTRASLLTGLYAHQAGVGHMVDSGKASLPGYRGDLSANSVTIAQVLKTAGYRTLMSGKWHITPVTSSKHNWPLQRGFDRFYGTIHGAGSFYDPVTLSRGNESAAPEGESYYYTDAIASNAISFLDEVKSEPFFLYLAFTAPHWPMHALDEDIAKYRGRYAKGWDVLRAERHARQVQLGVIGKNTPLSPRDPDGQAWEAATEKPWQERRMEVYAAMVDRLDQNIGRVLEKIRRMGQEENTLVLFLADNGGCAEVLRGEGKALHIPKRTRDGRPVKFGNIPAILPGKADDYQSYGLEWANASNTPFRLYKHWVHEGGISSPLIARWPVGIRKRGGFVREPAHLIDIMATCVDLAQAKYPGGEISPME